MMDIDTPVSDTRIFHYVMFSGITSHNCVCTFCNIHAASVSNRTKSLDQLIKFVKNLLSF